MNNSGSSKEDLLNNFNVHDDLKNFDVPELREINMKDRLPFAICPINLLGNLNIGTMIRTACLMGAERVIVFGRRQYDRRSCVGSYHYFPIERVGGIDDDMNLDPDLFWDTMNDFNYVPVFIETGGKTITDMQISDFNNKKPCLIFGSESHGIPANLIRDSNLIYSIPQRGVIRSLNVSSAAAIAMWEISKLYG